MGKSLKNRGALDRRHNKKILKVVSSDIVKLLNQEASKRNSAQELSYDRPDPLLVARRYGDETIALMCALFGYGNAVSIVRFLEKFDFELLNCPDDTIKKHVSRMRYRFQNSQDIATFCIVLKRLREIDSIEAIIYEGYRKNRSILEGLRRLIKVIYALTTYRSDGFCFLVGKPPPMHDKYYLWGAYKRYMMYFRWMVRNDHLDMGLWGRIDRSDLLMPLDTHSAAVARKLGLLQRKSNDMAAVLELTQSLRLLDKNDPLKYDFALYRLGQERLV